MKVLFVANFHLTELMSEVSIQLEEAGVECHFLSFSTFFSKKYLSAYSIDRLHEPHGVFDRAYAKQHEEACKSCVALPDFVTSMVRRDRVLRNWNPVAVKHSLSLFIEWLNCVYSQNRFDLIISESTWTVERVVYEVAKLNGIPYVTPASTRYPPKRWFFSDGFGFENIHSECHGSGTFQTIEMSNFTSGSMTLDWAPSVKQEGKIKRVIYLTTEKYSCVRESRTNPTQRSLLDYFRRDSSFRSSLRYFPTLLINSCLRREIRSVKDFVFAPLHVQPEASIDAYAAGVADQINVFKSIAKSLPQGWVLLVKDHPNGMGKRMILDYLTLFLDPRIRLISAFADNTKILEDARCVYTATGTIGMEASLKGTAVVMGSRTYFSKLPGVFVAREPWNFDWERVKIIPPLEIQSWRTQQESFFLQLVNSSFEGIWAGRYSPVKALCEDNIRAISNSIHSFLSTLKDAR